MAVPSRHLSELTLPDLNATVAALMTRVGMALPERPSGRCGMDRATEKSPKSRKGRGTAAESGLGESGAGAVSSQSAATPPALFVEAAHLLQPVPRALLGQGSDTAESFAPAGVEDTEPTSPARLVHLATIMAPVSVAELVGPLQGPDAAAAALFRYIGHRDREHFAVLHLDTRHRIRGVEIVAIGSLNQAVVHPREVFKAAILSNAAALICGHNHPSGDPTPSEDDLELHRHLKDAGKLLGIEVVDHIVFGDTTYWSMERGSVATLPSAALS